MTASVAEQFRSFAAGKLEDSLANIERCLGLLDETGVWWRPNEHSNSIGNLVLHLAGNVRQWIVGGIGGRANERDRSAEFAERGPRPTAEILELLRGAVVEACSVIRAFDERGLAAEYDIQGYAVSGTAAVFHVVEHFSLHTGQIVSTTKLILDRDLSLYDANGRRLDGRESGVP